MNDAKFSALLIRLPLGGVAALGVSAARSLRAAGASFELEPLFTTAQPRAGRGVAAARRGWEWHIARPTAKVTGAHAWELAHEALASRLGLAVGGEVYIEPDLEQQWLPANPLVPEQVGLAAAAKGVFDDQIENLPGIPGRFAWHLGDAYSQLKPARDVAANGTAVRIVHLDTGYDPDHSVVPSIYAEISNAISWMISRRMMRTIPARMVS
jgi:hypothetical protein